MEILSGSKDHLEPELHPDLHLARAQSGGGPPVEGREQVAAETTVVDVVEDVIRRHEKLHRVTGIQGRVSSAAAAAAATATARTLREEWRLTE